MWGGGATGQPKAYQTMEKSEAFMKIRAEITFLS